jgi:hypothetical protein
MAVTREKMAELKGKFAEAGLLEAEQQEEERDELQSGEAEGEEQVIEGEDEGEEIAEGDEEGEEAEIEGEVEGEEAADAYTPQELAEAIGWDAAELYESLQIPLDDGQGSVSLGEFKNQFQNLSRENRQLKTQIEEGQAQTGSFAQAQQVSHEMQRLQFYLESIDQMERNTNWKELEEFNPNDAILKRQKFADARRDTEEQLRKVAMYEQQMTQQLLAKASEKMVELIPAWKDTEAMKADQNAIRGHMHKYQFSDQEINMIRDPRTMAMLKEYADMKAKFEEAGLALKKVRKAPRVLRGPGGRFTSAAQTKQALAAQKVKKAQKSKNRFDEVDAVKALLNTRT